jgi:predicted RNA-binding Zn-ribbon protein involved in translation (DUF1610 family)
MSLWLEEKYLRYLSGKLERFQQKGNHLSNFRCPLCGDSETKKTKARGYCFAKQQTLIFKCHNCDIALPFAALLKRLAPQLYNEYLLEKLRDETYVPDSPIIASEAPVGDVLRPVHVFPLGDPNRLPPVLNIVYNYVAGRMIGRSGLARLYATTEARTWLTPLVGAEKSARTIDGEPYLIMPMILPDGEWYGAQLRMIGRKEYITFRWSHAPLKMFGLDALNTDQRIYVMEGPLDSLFLPNSIAAMGSDLLSAMQILETSGVLHTSLLRTYVWDNEPRNRDVRRHIETAILQNQSVVIWPSDYPKDINDMVLSGIDVIGTVSARTFSGLSAQLEFQTWKR